MLETVSTLMILLLMARVVVVVQQILALAGTD